MKAAKESIYAYLVNPELEPPGFMVDFDSHYEAYLSRISDEKPSIGDVDTQLLEASEPEVSVSTRSTRSSKIVSTKAPDAEKSPEKEIASPLEERGRMSTRRQAAKRKFSDSADEVSASSGSPKKSRSDVTVEREDYSDLIKINPTAVESTVEIAADEEDDVAAELPDGFVTTSGKMSN